jgi:hypothetical protein
MSLKPTVGIRGMKEIDLAPFQWRFWPRRCVLRIWLHSANVPGENNVVLQRPIAAMLAFAGIRSSYEGRYCSERKVPHVCDFWTLRYPGTKMEAFRRENLYFNCVRMQLRHFSRSHRSKSHDETVVFHVERPLEGKISIDKPNDKTSRKAWFQPLDLLLLILVPD